MSGGPLLTFKKKHQQSIYRRTLPRSQHQSSTTATCNNKMYLTRVLHVVATTLLTGVLAHPGTDLVDPHAITDLNARSPLSPRLDLCGGCCARCGFTYCCSGPACFDVCPDCCGGG